MTIIEPPVYGPPAPDERDGLNTTPRPLTNAMRRVVRDERRDRVALMVLAHVPYRRMAATLGVSLGTIAQDVTAIRDLWKASAAGSYEQHLSEELAKLDALERTWMPRALDPNPPDNEAAARAA